MSNSKMINDIANLTELVDIQTKKWNGLESYLRNYYSEVRLEQLKNNENFFDIALRTKLNLLDEIIKKLEKLDKGR